MKTARSPVAALTSVEAALALLLDGLKPVEPVDEPLATALGGVAAGTASLAGRLPARDEAAVDGFAFHARDLAGASSYSPLALPASPPWVEAGEAMPEGCDCVIDAELVDAAGSIVQVLGEAIPGQGVRRAGEDFSAGQELFRAGQRLCALDILAARRAGLDRLTVRRPRVRIVNVGAADGSNSTTEFVTDCAKAAGARIAAIETKARDAASIAAALEAGECDFIVIVGGTGAGRRDETATALAERGALVAHGMALQPGRTTAIGTIGQTPVVALPGAPNQAFAVWLTLVEPVLDRLAGRESRQATRRPLAKKISSGVGVTELVLLKHAEGMWMPLAIGALSLGQIVAADAWLAIPGGSEGYAAGAEVAAFPLRDMI